MDEYDLEQKGYRVCRGATWGWYIEVRTGGTWLVVREDGRLDSLAMMRTYQHKKQAIIAARRMYRHDETQRKRKLAEMYARKGVAA